MKKEKLVHPKQNVQRGDKTILHIMGRENYRNIE
jgi:hypothetical protein